jgi:hypothetical protein
MIDLKTYSGLGVGFEASLFTSAINTAKQEANLIADFAHYELLVQSLDFLYVSSLGYLAAAEADRKICLTPSNLILVSIAEELNALVDKLKLFNSESINRSNLIDRTLRAFGAVQALYDQLLDNSFDFSDEDAREEWKARQIYP